MRGMWAAAIAAMAVAAAAAVVTQAPPAPRQVRLTLSEGTSMAAALSPDGRTVAIDLLGALWTYEAAGGPARRILEDGYDARLPVWSPDGRRLAFQAYHRDTWHVWIVDADGGGLQQVTFGPFDDREPFWSPDGTRLAFSSDRSGHYDIWIAALASGEVTRLTTGPANESMPAWSPDGREIAFVSDRQPRGIYAQPVSGGAERRLVEDPSAVAAPAWAPDGTSVAYTTIDGAVARLIVAGKNIAEPTEDLFPFRPQFVAGGDVLYTADGVVKRRPVAGGAARPLPFTAEIAFSRAPFTPKGRRFAEDGPQPVRGLMHPAISPDGARIAFAALGDLWLLGAAEGASAVPERLTQDVFVETNPVWSPDGQELAYSSDRDGAVGLWIRDLRTGRDRRVAANGTTASWSPDGGRLAFLDTESTLRVVDVASREERQAHDRIFEPGRPSWSPDGRAVVMSALRPYSSRFREGTNQVLWVAVEPETTAAGKGAFPADRWFDPVPHQSVGMRENFGPVWAPNGREMAAIVDGSLTTFPVARDGTPIGPSRRVSEDLASSPSWTGDSRRILYQVADRFRLVTLADGSVRDITPAWSWTPRRTTGTMTVHAARLFDGTAGGGVRTNVDVVDRRRPHHRGGAASRRPAPRHRRRRVGRDRRARLDREPCPPVQGAGRGAGPHLPVLRRDLGPQSGGQRLRRAGGARGDRVGRTGRAARLHHRRAARRHPHLLPGRRRARRRRPRRCAARTRDHAPLRLHQDLRAAARPAAAAGHRRRRTAPGCR